MLCERKVARVGIRGVKIEGYRPYILGFFGKEADISYGILVDLIDRHIKADVVRGCVSYVFHDAVVGVASDGVVARFIAVEAEEDQICFRKIDRVGTVCHGINDEKAHFLGFPNEIAQSKVPITPKEGFASAEKKNANAHVIKLLHFALDLTVGMDDSGDIVDRAMLAMQIAFVGDDHRAEDGGFLTEQDRLKPKACEMKKRRNFHRDFPFDSLIQEDKNEDCRKDAEKGAGNRILRIVKRKADTNHGQQNGRREETVAEDRG